MKRRFSLLAAAVLVSAGLTLGASITASGIVTPTVDGIDPNSGSTAGGTQVAIFGSGFIGATRVNFGGTPVFQFFTADDHRIFTNSPPGAAGTIDVTVSAGTISSATSPGDHFTYKVTLPRVDAVDPRQGTAAGGTTVQIFGSGLSGATAVHFGATTVACGAGPLAPIAAQALRMDAARSAAMSKQTTHAAGGTAGAGGGGLCIPRDDGQLSVNSPAGTASATPVDITVTTAAGTSAVGPGDRYTYVAPVAPVVNAVGPGHGSASGGTNVAIIGSGLSGVTAVNFGANTITPCPGMAQAASRLLRLAPRKAVRERIATPAAAAGGGGGPCFFAGGSDSRLDVPTPPGTVGRVDVTVTTAAGTSATSNAAKFTYDVPGAPEVDAVDPNHATKFGGANITLHGVGFTDATAVHFGAQSLPPCASPGATGCFTVFGDAAIFVVSPAGPANTTVDVTVTTPRGTSATNPADKFTYENPSAPVIDVIDPAEGPAPGGTNVTLYGTGFSGATKVEFGATTITPCPAAGPCLSVAGDQMLFLQTPGQATAGPVIVKLTTPAGTASTSFTYTPAPLPVVSGVSPSSGPAAGGTTVWISGSGFSGATHVTFGGNEAAFFVPFGGDGVIQATSPGVPPGTGTVDIRVTTPGGTSAIGPNDHYTYTASTPVVATVTSVSPSSGTTQGRELVYITGSGFASDASGPSATTVLFGDTPVGFSLIADNLISAMTPPHNAGAVHVTVYNTAGQSATSPDDYFTFMSPAPPPPSPGVSGVTPNQGTKYGGSSVNIYGRGFANATSLAFGGTSVPPCSPSTFQTCFNIFDDNSIFTMSPPGNVGTVHITVTTPLGTSPASNADRYTYVTPGPPVVNAIDPRQGPTDGGTPVNIYGSGFGGATSVSIGGSSEPPCSPSTFGPCFFFNNDNWINATAPPGPAGTVHVTVTTPSGTSSTSNADAYLYVPTPPPTITKVSPNSGGSSGGTVVYISGTNLQAVNTVNFGPNPVLGGFFPASPNVIVVGGGTPPGNPGTVQVTVTSPSGTSPTTPADQFTYVQSPPPTITAIGPSHGSSEGGTIVYVTGTDLGGAFNVMFGSQSTFNFFSSGGNLIQTGSPPGMEGSTVDIRVTTPAGTSAAVAADRFSYTAAGAPSITAVSPNTGPPFTQLLISGRNLGNATEVKFGSNPAPWFFSPAPGVLWTASPPGAVGTVDVKVTTPDGITATVADDRYTYTAAPAPAITAISPSSGPSGTTVLISGTDFRGPSNVSFGGTTSPNFFQLTPGVMLATSPPAAASATPVDITVTALGGTSATSAADLYTFTAAPPPTVTWVSPNIGPAGTIVTITGTALGGATAVKFGGVTAPNPFIRSDTLIRVASPPGSGTVDVTVITATGTSPTSAADKYSYLLTANAWEDHGGLLTSGPSASTWGSGRLDAFVRGGDGQIWHRYLSAGTYYWEPLTGSQATSDAATISTGVGKIDVFVRGADSALWQKTFAGGAWGSWTRLGGLIADSPAVVSLGAGKLDVFVRGTDGKLWYDSFNGTTWTWNLAGGRLAAAPAGVSASAGTADVFVMGTDSQLWRYATPSGIWSPLGGHLAVKPAATSGTAGVLDVFVEGTDLHLWHWSNPGGTGSWELIGGLLGAAPAATSWGSGRLDVMVRGTDAHLYHAWSSGTSWSWEGLGGQLIGSPAVVTWGVGRLDVFARGTDNRLWHLSFG